VKVGRRVLLTIVTLVAVTIAAVTLWAWTPDLPRSALEAKYLEQPGDMIEVGGMRLHVRDRGPRDAPAVIMIHGTASHLQSWDDWAAGLEDRFRVVLLDLPGHGLSVPDPTGDYSDERTVALLVELMDRLGIERTNLIGSSLGGRIAWKFAAAFPDRTAKLVLVSPDGFASPGFEYGKAPDVPASLSLMKHFLPKRLLRPQLAAAYADGGKMSGATLQRYHDLMRAPGNREALLERMRQTVLVPPEPYLEKITAPTLLVWGEQDRMIPVSNGQDYLRVMPDAQLVSFPDLGHVPQEEAPEMSLQAVRAFLERP
jgi:pimeloyl-ACP methyl ester carboxylesterase